MFSDPPPSKSFPVRRVRKYSRARQPADNSIIRCMRFAWWITKATDTHSEYLIVCFYTITVVTRRALKLRLYYIVYLVNKSVKTAEIFVELCLLCSLQI